ncbi:MAG: PAS domain-containing protein [Anaerolineae bacterium]|nr:PAS domain-containing protein [Anaerolineae bacterium]
MAPTPELLLDMLFDRTPMVVAVLDREFRMQRLNPTWIDFAALYSASSREEIVPGAYYFDLFPGSEPTILPLFERVLAGETVRQHAVRLETQGIVSYWDIVLQPVVAGDKVAGILDIGIDATERERTIEAMREREERLDLVMRGTNDGIWDWNLKTDSVYFSPRWKSMLGYGEEEIAAHSSSWRELVHPEELERVLGILEAHLRGDTPVYEVEHRVRHRDGSYRWILARGTAVRDQAGRATRIVGSHTDITERKEATAALQESQRMLATLMDNLPGMAYRCHNAPEWTMEFVSEGSVALTGYTSALLTGSHGVRYGDLIHVDDREQVWNEVQAALTADEPHELSYRLRTASGEEKWVWEHGRGVRNSVGTVVALEGFVTDITERITARQGLEQRVAKRTQELSTLLEVSHNLTSTLALEPLLALVLDQLQVVVAYDGASILVADGDSLQLVAYRGPIPQEEALGLRFSLARAGANRAVIEARKPVVIPDVRGDSPEARAFRETAGATLGREFDYVRSWLGVPLVVKDGILGMISLDHGQANYYTKEHCELVLAFANQVAVTLENARLFSQLERRNQEIEALYQADEELYRSLDMEQVLQKIVDVAVEVLHADKSSIMVWDAAHERLVVRAARGFAPETFAAMSFAADEGLIGEAATSGEMVVVESVAGDRRVARRITDAEGIQSFIHLPLRRNGEVFGVFNVDFAEPRAFPADERRLFTALGQRAALAIENAYLFSEEKERRRVAESLRETLSLLNAGRPMQETLRFIVEQAMTILGADAGVVFRLDAETEAIVVEATAGLPEALRHVESLPYVASSANRATIRGEAFVEADLETAMRVEAELVKELPPEAREWLEMLAEHYGAFLSAPFGFGDAARGDITLYYATAKQFGEEEISLAVTFGEQAALAAANAALRQHAEASAVAEERNRLARDLHDAVSQTLFSASLIAEVLPAIMARDPEQGKERLAELRELTRGALAEMRTLLLELRPTALTESGLDELLRQLCDAIIGRSRLPVELSVGGDGELPPEVQVAFYRIAQESLNNVVKHAAASQVVVRLQYEPDAVALTVTDDGRGFATDAVAPNSLGVGIMRERAEKTGMQLAIESEVGAGTRVRCVWARPARSTAVA